MNQIRIIAVVVTYNRLNLLKEGLQGIYDQTYPVDKIIIIDNDSTDGTRDWLKTIESDKIQLIFQENTGGAGGFNTGIKTAYEQGYDWIWVMDDDVCPTDTCLENLLQYKDISECINPNKRYKDGNPYIWQQYLNPFNGERIDVKNFHFEQGNKICFVNVACFEGMLISGKLVGKIGFPDKNYFTVDDDTEYGFRASFFTNVSYVRDAVMVKNKNKSEDKLSPFFWYYFFRNQFLLCRSINSYEFKTYEISKMTFFFTTFKRALRYIRFFKEAGETNKKEKVKSILRGISDGLRNKVGQTYKDKTRY